MEFKYLDLTACKTSTTKIKNQTKGKYEKILNNLLGIKNVDSAIFTKLSSMNQDLTKIVPAPEQQNKILTKSDFEIEVSKLVFTSDVEDVIEEILSTSDLEELETFLKKINIKLSQDTVRKIKSKRLALWEAKDKIAQKIKQEQAFFIVKWKRYIKQVNDAYEQTNMWPLFVATYFLQAKINDKVIYAPLVLKEVEVEIRNNTVFLRTRSGSVSLNEKLIFLLEELTGMVIPPVDNEADRISINDIVQELDHFLKDSIQFVSFDVNDTFPDLRKQDVKSNNLIRTPGLVLLFAQPLGGPLRRATIDLINDNRMDNLIDLNPDDFFGIDERSINNIIQEPKKIARICPTDPSQEKAILSSLNNHTIIIGPPGTGKSQTIANILTNVLLNNKKALFISQKRVALEVVLERMGQLKNFTLQLVEQKKRATSNEKGEFYKYLGSYIEQIKAHYNALATEAHLMTFTSNQQMNYWVTKKQNQHLEQSEIDQFCDLKTNVQRIDQPLFEQMQEVFSKLNELNKLEELDTISELKIRNLKALAEKLNVEPKFKFLGLRFYGSAFKNYWKTNLKLLDLIEEYNLNKKTINLIKNLKAPKNVLNLNHIYDLHNQPVPDHNRFKTNEAEILQILIDRSKQIYQQIHKSDATWSRKFIGRIQRKYTQPTKFVALFKKELKKLFNVVVSTPEALSSFIDFKHDHYDYVIFDESSQIFLEKAIAYMSIGKKIIVAGDDQQMQPSNWFNNRYDSDDEYQEDEEIDSLLTYAINSGIPKQTLELNYRSAAASLTAFSAKEFYNCDLKGVDKNERIIQPIEIINVEGEWINQRNDIEAHKLIEVLKANLDAYEKIILLTLNAQQMNHIDVLLSTNEPEIYNKVVDGEIVLRNLENIQGDEADLVIVSIAYTKTAALAATYVGRSGGRNALNVAITRAKKKMIVIKSIHSSEVRISSESNLDLQTFKRWLQFLELNESEQKVYSVTDDPETNIQSVESMFEYEVYQWLMNQNFHKAMKVEVQYPVGSYRIDIALLDLTTNKYLLGIEIDGLRYHSTTKQKYHDLVRQNFIESKGYKIIRIPELMWKTNKSQILEMIKANI